MGMKGAWLCKTISFGETRQFVRHTTSGSSLGGDCRRALAAMAAVDTTTRVRQVVVRAMALVAPGFVVQGGVTTR
jgi:hypothetical protein